MPDIEIKHAAIVCILEILKKHTDYDHRLTRQEIAEYLEKDYGIVLERKAISRNINILKLSDYDIDDDGKGCYLRSREFLDSELHLLIDAVLGSKHITSKQSKDLIDRLCALSNKYFRSSIKYIHAVGDVDKTDNKGVFLNIEIIDQAIENGKKIKYDYNKFGIDKKLHRSSQHTVSPYTMLLHNQRYYLMAYSDKYEKVIFHRLDHITNTSLLTEEYAKPIRSVPEYSDGIDYKELTTARPYMYTDKPERVTFTADSCIIDQVVDWFGKSAQITKRDKDDKVDVRITVSPNAMELWALQYVNHVEIVYPDSLRQRVKEDLKNAMEKYK